MGADGLGLFSLATRRPCDRHSRLPRSTPARVGARQEGAYETICFCSVCRRRAGPGRLRDGDALPARRRPPPRRRRGGFAETQIEANRWRVTFSGNSLTSRDTVERYLLYRSAELTVQQGYDWFAAGDRATDKSTQTFVDPYFDAYWGPRWGFLSPTLRLGLWPLG